MRCGSIPNEIKRTENPFQNNEWFEREQRNILDVNRWNRQLLGLTFDYGLKDIINWKTVLFIKQLINHLALLVKYQ